MEAVGKITPLYPLNRRVGGPQSRSGSFGEKSLASTVIRSFGEKSLASTVIRSFGEKSLASTVIRNFGEKSLVSTVIRSFGEKSLASSVIRTSDRPTHNVSPVPTTMSRLLQRDTSLTYVVDLACRCV